MITEVKKKRHRLKIALGLALLGIMVGAIMFIIKKDARLVENGYNHENNLKIRGEVGQRINKLLITQNGRSGFCSSYDLTEDKNIQLTAAHCFQEGPPEELQEFLEGIGVLKKLDKTTKIQAYTNKLSQINGFEILFIDRQTDIAIIGKKGTRPKKKIKLEMPEQTEYIYSVGFPGTTAGSNFVISKGLFLGLDDADPVLTDIERTTAYVQQGMSGGPTFNELGQLIGVNSNKFQLGEEAPLTGGFNASFGIIGCGIAGFKSIEKAVRQINDRFFW